MAPFISTLFFFASFAASALRGSAAPLVGRQVGDLQCNLARVQIITGLIATNEAVNNLGIAAAAANDTTSVFSAMVASAGLQLANQGINQIAIALVDGQAAPASSRTLVGQGTLAAFTALSQINSTDANVTMITEDATTKLNNSATAGNQVVENCT